MTNEQVTLVWTIVGSVAGVLSFLATILVAWLVYRLQKRDVYQQDLAAQAAKKKQLLTALRQTVERNRGHAERLLSLKPGTVFFSNFDLGVFDGTAAVKYDVLDDWHFCEEIDEFRSAVWLCHRQAERLLDMDVNGETRSQLRGLLRDNLRENLEVVRRQSQTILTAWPK